MTHAVYTENTVANPSALQFVDARTFLDHVPADELLVAIVELCRELVLLRDLKAGDVAGASSSSGAQGAAENPYVMSAEEVKSRVACIIDIELLIYEATSTEICFLSIDSYHRNLYDIDSSIIKVGSQEKKVLRRKFSYQYRPQATLLSK